jgi:hypothetical protein
MQFTNAGHEMSLRNNWMKSVRLCDRYENWIIPIRNKTSLVNTEVHVDEIC